MAEQLLHICRPAAQDDPQWPAGVSKGYVVLHEGPAEVGKPVQIHDAVMIIDDDGSLHVDMDPEGREGTITDG